jgi:hypothetical protein
VPEVIRCGHLSETRHLAARPRSRPPNLWDTPGAEVVTTAGHKARWLDRYRCSETHSWAVREWLWRGGERDWRRNPK